MSSETININPPERPGSSLDQPLEHRPLAGASERSSPSMMSLGHLARLIVEEGDAEALTELIQRPLFHMDGKSQLNLVAAIGHFRCRHLAQDNEHADRAYDMTLDRFTRLKEADAFPPASGNGVDCRRYYRAYMQHLNDKRGRSSDRSALEWEMYEVKALFVLIRHHYNLALKECHRNSLFTRYVLRLPKGKLKLLMPRSISGRDRNRWLRAHVPDADPTRPSEAQRIQAIIDSHFGQIRSLSLDPDARISSDIPWFSPPQIPGEDCFNVSVEGLADCVAREKVANIVQQRPAIQALGAIRLAKLIQAIFDLLTDDQGSLEEIASQFRVSKPTLSRFAGFRWNSPTRQNSGVPDLWRNTAQVIGSDPEFVEAAKRAGVWQRVEEVAASTAAHSCAQSRL